MLFGHFVLLDCARLIVGFLHMAMSGRALRCELAFSGSSNRKPLTPITCLIGKGVPSSNLLLVLGVTDGNSCQIAV